MDARLDIIGAGPERPRLEQLVRELGLDGVVAFRGRVSEEELRRAYAGADAFVLPSVLDARQDTEGLGVVLLEAMNYSVPVIASDIGGIPDIVEHEQTGLLVPPGDEVALAAALTRVLGDRALARRLGDAGRERLRDEFSWDHIVARWEGVYARALAGSSAA